MVTVQAAGTACGPLLNLLLWFSYQEVNPSTKPFLTYESQLDKLANEKQLIISDYEKALQILKDIGYFSLIGGYKTPFINPMTRIYQNKNQSQTISEDTLLSMMGFPKNWASIMRYQLHITGFHSKKT